MGQTNAVALTSIGGSFILIFHAFIIAIENSLNSRPITNLFSDCIGA